MPVAEEPSGGKANLARFLPFSQLHCGPTACKTAAIQRRGPKRSMGSNGTKPGGGG